MNELSHWDIPSTPLDIPGWHSPISSNDKDINSACMRFLRDKAHEMLPGYDVKRWPRAAPMQTRTLVEIVCDRTLDLLGDLEYDLWSVLSEHEKRQSIAAAARGRVFSFYRSIAYHVTFTLGNRDKQPEPIFELEYFRLGLQDIFDYFTELRGIYVACGDLSPLSIGDGEGLVDSRMDA